MNTFAARAAVTIEDIMGCGSLCKGSHWHNEAFLPPLIPDLLWKVGRTPRIVWDDGKGGDYSIRQAEMLLLMKQSI